ncbi:hypothetical protein N9112_00160 [bacterium]|nr:hypothetical protein [bacterium]
MTIVSVAYQMKQAKKMKQRMKEQREAAEEARKGFEFTVEGSISTLPIVYGRAKIGGNRVFHNVKHNYSHAAPNADISFSNSTYFTASRGGSKNEFLYYQQAICQGPIGGVRDVILDESVYLDDSDLNKGSNHIVIDYHYGGGVVDSKISKNNASRAASSFDGIAYASVICKIDRDDPRFNGVPILQTLLEGKKVRAVASGVLSGTRVYSNNPSWCLLDYLLDPDSGKGLSETQLDLASFEAAAAVCDTVVRTSVATGGKFWRPTTTTGGSEVTLRDIVLYECNAVIDPNKPIRDNIEILLATMGDARLVWSAGKYKLNLQYPANNAAISLETTITDDDILQEANVDIQWPDASNRLNHATIKYHNESHNFAEDTASWPPKVNDSEYYGILGDVYSPATGWDTDVASSGFMDDYAVWDGGSTTTDLLYKFVAKNSGLMDIKVAAQDSCTLVVSDGATVYSGGNSNWQSPTTATLTLVAGAIYTVTVSATAGGSLRGVAAQITDAGYDVWNTREPAYEDIQQKALTSTVYDEFIAEDNGLPLEVEIYEDGITDYYHALAKAEELVRTSRTAFKLDFEYHLSTHDGYLEPGDFIKFESNTLDLGISTPLYLRINEVHVKEDATCRISAERFDYSQLAWNIDDTEYVRPPSIYGDSLVPPFQLSYVAATTELDRSAGRLDWAAVSSSSVVGYEVGLNRNGAVDNEGSYIFEVLGDTNTNVFYLPALGTADTLLFGVRSMTSAGRKSAWTNTSTSVDLPTVLKPPSVSDLSIASYGTGSESVKLSWSIPALRLTTDPYDDHEKVFIYRNTVNSFGGAVAVGVAYGDEYLDTPTTYGPVYYWVSPVSKRGVIADASNVVSLTVNHVDILYNAAVPPTPTGLVATPGYSTVFLSWTIPAYTNHKSTEIWRSETNSLGSSIRVGVVEGSQFADPAEPGTTYYYWVRLVSSSNILSAYNAGVSAGVEATTSPDVVKVMETLSDAYGGNSESPFFQIDAPTLINGVSVPAGTYMKNALIHDAAITTAKIQNLAVDNAKIADLDVGKITGNTADFVSANINDATITTAKIADTIQSSNYDASNGWQLNKNGSAFFNAGVQVKGTITGSTITGSTINGGTIIGATIFTGSTVYYATDAGDPYYYDAANAGTGYVAGGTSGSFTTANFDSAVIPFYSYNANPSTEYYRYKKLQKTLEAHIVINGVANTRDSHWYGQKGQVFMEGGTLVAETNYYNGGSLTLFNSQYGVRVRTGTHTGGPMGSVPWTLTSSKVDANSSWLIDVEYTINYTGDNRLWHRFALTTWSGDSARSIASHHAQCPSEY